MKVDRLETHDRLLYFHKDQKYAIAQGAEDCLKRNQLSLALQDKSPYVYIFAFPKTIGLDEKIAMYRSGKFGSFDRIPEKRLIWQPRLTKPEAQTNSYLFRAESHTDLLEISWLLPPEELWDQYEKGNMVEHEWVNWSIDQFLNNKRGLEAPTAGDLSEERAKQIYRAVLQEMEPKKFQMI